MNEAKNRFEVIASSLRGKFFIYCSAILITAILIEILFYGLALYYFHLRGRNLNILNAQISLGQIFFENPVTEYMQARYVGHFDHLATQRKWNVADPIFGWRLGKNIAITHRHGAAEGLEWRITNPQGFPVAGKLSFNVERRKPLGVFRVIIFGGSTVEGVGVKNPLNNLPSQLARLLEKSSNPPKGYTKFELINAGVNGYNSSNEFLFFATEMIQYDPDLVIFYNGCNEFTYRSRHLKENPDHPFPKRNAKHGEMVDRLNESYTYSGPMSHLIQNVITKIYDLSGKLASLWFMKRLIQTVVIERSLVLKKSEGGLGFEIDFELTPNIHPSNAKNIKKNVHHYEQNIRDAINLARGKGINVAFFLQPIAGIDEKKYVGWEKKWFQSSQEDIKARRIFYENARSMAQRLSGSFPVTSETCIADLSTSTKNEEKRIYTDSFHLNAKGNAIVAQSIKDSLIECAMIEST